MAETTDRNSVRILGPTVEWTIVVSVFAWLMLASGCGVMDDPSSPINEEKDQTSLGQSSDTINGGSRNVKVTCTSGSIT